MNQLMTAFEKGGTLILINFTFAREIVQALLKERVTGLAGVPTLWSLLAQPNSTLSSSRFPTCGTSRIPAAQCHRPSSRSFGNPCRRRRSFSCTALPRHSARHIYPPEELDRRPTSMGKAIPDTEILVLNENGQLCKPGENRRTRAPRTDCVTRILEPAGRNGTRSPAQSSSAAGDGQLREGMLFGRSCQSGRKWLSILYRAARHNDQIVGGPHQPRPRLRKSCFRPVSYEAQL